MADFIPPLISSSPPPIPDFDDEEEDDVEFGMGSGINEDLDFSVTVGDDDNLEKKNDILELENRHLEMKAGTNNWKCEEQDSTSQDSGLCMVSQSSEGMSPLPQSDEDEKCNHEVDFTVTNNLKHSTTVMFNPEETNCEITNTLNNDKSIAQIEEVLPLDTGQISAELSSENQNCENNKTDLNNECDSDNEFVWGEPTSVNDDLFQNCHLTDNVSISNSEKLIPNISNDLVVEECINDTFYYDNINNHDVIEYENESEMKGNCSVIGSSQLNCISDDNVSLSDNVLNNIDNNVCDNSNSIKIDSYAVNYDDDFGNFASVTIPNCDSVVDNCSIISDPSDQLINNSSEDYDEQTNGFDVKVDKRNSVITNTTDFEESNIIRDSCITTGLNTFETSENSSKVYSKQDGFSSENTCDDSHRLNDGQSGKDDNDEFDDFSDFTQSSSIDLQSTEVSDRGHISTHKVVSCEQNLEETFPKSREENYPDIRTENFVEASPVWKHLSPLESTPALGFQWSNSLAHNKLLSALSIDSRNILFGSHWNGNIPRFAANLGTNPLQPVKATEILTGYSTSPVPPPSEDIAGVPDPHFDWVSSGLTNPLDCVTDKVSNDIEQLKKNSTPSSAVDNLNILSDEAENIISQLPDLNFMRKTYIEILISKG